MLDLSTSFKHQGDELIIQRTQDCTPIAEYARAQHNAGLHGTSEVKHAARIPSVIIEKYCNDNRVTFEQFMADPAHIRRVVQHPDNSAFRIWKGAF